MAKTPMIAVSLAQSVEGKKGLEDMTVREALAFVSGRFMDEDGESSMTEGEMLGYLAVYGARRMMALAKDGERVAAKEAPSHVYLPRPVDGAVHAGKLAGAVGEARGAFAAMLWGAKKEPKAIEAAPVKAPKAPKAKKERTAAQVAATARMLAAKSAKAKPAPAAPVKSDKGAARAAKVAAKAAKLGASVPVTRTDLTPETIAQPNKAAPVKSVTLANGATFQIEDSTGI